MSATPLPVSIALAGHTMVPVARKVTATPMMAGEHRGEDLRDADLEVQAHLPQRVDGDDDRGHMQAQVADLGAPVRVPTDPEGATRRTCHGGRSVTLLGRNNRLGPSGGRSSHVGR
jgi:hypothetical protein